MIIDQNGKSVSKRVRKERDGTWSATVWFGAGTLSNPATSTRRYYGYQTRSDARKADISDKPDQFLRRGN